MLSFNRFLTVNVLLSALVFGQFALVSHAEPTYRRVYDARAGKYVFVENTAQSRARSAMRDPIVKQAAVGAAVGAGTGLITDRSSLLRGAGIGALTGAGTGLIDTSRTLENKPLLRSSLKGAVIGTGAGAVIRTSKTKGAVIGAGAGAGTHLLRDYLRSDY